jgi:hypothetical protein
VTSESDVLGRIRSLVEEEHALRNGRAEETAAGREANRLQEVEVELDQCWDLLRQRRALREAGENPDAARPRSGPRVEGYLG